MGAALLDRNTKGIAGIMSFSHRLIITGSVSTVRRG